MFDNVSAAVALSMPGIDTRNFISLGLVAEQTQDFDPIQFKDETGAAHTAPMVAVKLQPGGYTVQCRVASYVAGNGEGEWYPFVQGDEVIVAIPHGDELAGCCIIGRLNQDSDIWPAKVAGQDATKNTFGFRRMRTPYILETAESYMVRSATTSANMTITREGNLFLVSGDSHSLILNTELIKLSTGDDSVFLQIDVEKQQLFISAGSTNFVVDPSASNFLTTGTLNIGTSGVQGTGHAITLEQVVNIINSTFAAIGTAIPGNISGAALAGSAIAIINAGLLLANAGSAAPFAGSILLGLQIPPDPLGLAPGIGRAGLLI